MSMNSIYNNEARQRERYALTSDVIGALRQGKKLTMKGACPWARGAWIALDKKEGKLVNQDGHETRAEYRALLALNSHAHYWYEEWEEPKPKVEITPDMVGRKVRLFNNEVALITSFVPDADADALYPVRLGNGHSYTRAGVHTVNSIDKTLDIAEVLP